LKYYNTRPGIDFSQRKVLMLAPIGKAAYNIKGNTIHSVAIPASQSLRDNKSLDSSRLSTLWCRLGGIKQVECICTGLENTTNFKRNVVAWQSTCQNLL